LVVSNLLLDVLVRCVILTVCQASLSNPDAVSDGYLAGEPWVHLVVRLQVGMRLLGLCCFVRISSVFATEVLRAMKIGISIGT
jgi:hypothetical protein